MVRRWQLEYIVIGLAAVIHGGTALLRLNTFWPFPRLLDFGAFYAGALAMRQGLSPYPWPRSFADRMAEQLGFFLLPTLNSLPLWPWMLQPLTYLPFPWAAWGWTFFQLLVLWGCTQLVAQQARIRSKAGRGLLYGFLLTFGPVTLNLTLGQTGPLLLALALLIGHALTSRNGGLLGAIGGLWGPVVVTKAFPLLWLPALFLLDPKRLFVVSTGVALVIVALHGILLPQESAAYVKVFGETHISALVTGGSLDDQSLLAWGVRLSQPVQYQVPTLDPARRVTVRWSPVWSLPATWLYIGVVSLVFFIGLGVLFLLATRGKAAPTAAFYLWVLFVVLAIPHMERYNHVLLLPAMAWLWPQGTLGRWFVAGAYFLAALSRLTHVWVLILPPPWAGLATGFGTLAVLTLMAGMAWFLWTLDKPDHAEPFEETASA